MAHGRVIILFLCIMMFFLSGADAKNPDLAGTWYSASPDVLTREFDGYFSRIGDISLDGHPLAFIAPHAGYRFSGSVAAYTYKTAALFKPKTVILIGFSHKLDFDGVAVFTDEKYDTPLGALRTDMNITSKIRSMTDKVIDYPQAFNSENSIEIQLPMIRYAFGKDVSIVLFCFGRQDKKNVNIFSRAAAEALKNENDFVIIASTDLSHYLDYDSAVEKDGSTLGLLKNFNTDRFYEACAKNKYDLMCGPAAAASAISIAMELGADSIKVLKYANSGDTAGGKGRVVGYSSIVVYKKTGSAYDERVRRAEQGGYMMLSDEQRKILLSIARRSITAHFKKENPYEPVVNDKIFDEHMGAFVTLHKNGELRGCIGNMIGRQPLYLTVRDMAVASAFDDPRFGPLTEDELDNIDIEISVLSPMEKVSSYEDISVPGDGVMVKKGFRAGVYLPQVAEETGWGREEFLTSLCVHKAGISPYAWKTGDCDIYRFTAEVFGEKDYE